MGVKNLMKWIKKNAPSAIKTVQIDSLFGRVIAIDASLSIYQFLVSVRQMGQQLTDFDGNTTSHLQGILTRSLRLIKSGVKPVYVFDGAPPELKSGELSKRAERREEAEVALEAAKEKGDEDEIDKQSRRTVRLDKQQVEECQKLLRLMGIPYIVAPCEAEAQAAYIAKIGKAYGVATEDMDALAFASPVLIRHLSNSQGAADEITAIDYSVMMRESGITHEQFVDFCILSGCDYCDTIRNIGPKRAFELIKQYNNIENILAHLDKTKYPIPEDFDFVGARKLFFDHPVTTEIDLKWSKPDAENLKQFMVNEKGFSDVRIENVISALNKARSGGQQLRMDSFFSAVPKPMPVKKDTQKRTAKSAPPKKTK